MIYVKYPKVRFKIPADLLCLLTLKVSLIWHAYNLILLTPIASNSKLEFLPWSLLCIFSQIIMKYWQYHHSCLWIEFHLAFQSCSSVCECILQAFVLRGSLTTTKTPSSMWLKSYDNFCSVSPLKLKAVDNKRNMIFKSSSINDSSILFGLSFGLSWNGQEERQRSKLAGAWWPSSSVVTNHCSTDHQKHI